MPFDFELYNWPILTSYLEVNVVVLRLHSFLQQKPSSAAATYRWSGNRFTDTNDTDLHIIISVRLINPARDAVSLTQINYLHCKGEPRTEMGNVLKFNEGEKHSGRSFLFLFSTSAVTTSNHRRIQVMAAR